MKKINLILILTLFLINVSCKDKAIVKGSEKLDTEIEQYLKNVIELHGITGLALAVVQNDAVIYKGYFGKASLEESVPVNENTLFRVFSTTKLITSTGVFQLIEKGKISLEDNISMYLDSLPNNWQEIKIKNLLTHSSGLPDFIWHDNKISNTEMMKKLAKDKMSFEPGNQFQYNQTNYWLLAKIIEKVTGSNFENFVLNNQFNGSKNDILFSSNSQENIKNRAIRYFYNTELRTFEKDTNNDKRRGHAGNGLNITLDEFIKWNSQLDNNKILDAQTKSKMWTPFFFNDGKDKFLYGWGLYPTNNIESYGFTGGNLSAFRKFVDKNTTIILLSNGYKIPAYDIIVNDIARITIPELKNKRLTKEESTMELVVSKKFEEAKSAFTQLELENPRTDFGNLKWNINGIGNSLSKEGKKQESFKVFEFNAEINPDWWVAIAGLAESYESNDEIQTAIENYKKAIGLNTNNEWNYNPQMEEKIKKLQAEQTSENN